MSYARTCGTLRYATRPDAPKLVIIKGGLGGETQVGR